MAVNQNVKVNFNKQDLVTSADPNVVGTPAVEALSNAFNKGFITTDDIMSRVGGKAHKKAQLEDLMVQQATEDVMDPSQATGRKAIAMQQEQAVSRALNAGAPIPQTEDGKVDFNSLFQMVPQIAQWERAEQTRQQQLQELNESFSNRAKADPTKPRPIFLSWKGSQEVSDAEFLAERQRLIAPQHFTEMFPQGATSTAAGGAQGIAPAPAGTIIGQPVGDPGMRNIDGTERPPVAAQPAPSGAGPGAAGLGQAVQPAQPAAGQAAPGYFGEQGWKVVGRDASGFPIYADSKGSDRVPTEAEQKAFLATGRQQVESLMTAIEDMSQQDGKFDITGKSEGLRKWIADKLPNWVPYFGRENLSNEQKLYDSASSAWIQGLLRLESGAAISVPEERSYRNTFLPQTGDTYAVVKLKREMRRNVASKIDMLSERINKMEAEGRTQEADQLRKFTKPIILQEYAKSINGITANSPESITEDQIYTLDSLQQEVQSNNNNGVYTMSGLPAAEAGNPADVVQLRR